MEVIKLVLILLTFTLVTVTKEKAFANAETGKNSKNKDLKTILTQVSYIQYPITFQKQFMLVLFDSENKVNTIYLTFAKKLSFLIKPIDVEVQKIDGTTLDTYEMMVAAFLVINKTN